MQRSRTEIWMQMFNWAKQIRLPIVAHFLNWLDNKFLRRIHFKKASRKFMFSREQQFRLELLAFRTAIIQRQNFHLLSKLKILHIILRQCYLINYFLNFLCLKLYILNFQFEKGTRCHLGSSVFLNMLNHLFIPGNGLFTFNLLGTEFIQLNNFWYFLYVALEYNIWDV